MPHPKSQVIRFQSQLSRNNPLHLIVNQVLLNTALKGSEKQEAEKQTKTFGEDKKSFSSV